jgi:hypothetical protein
MKKTIKTITIHSRSSYWTSRENRDEVEVDADDLAKEIEAQCNNLEQAGYKISKITPINSGNLVGGSGAYYTESVLVVAEKN